MSISRLIHAGRSGGVASFLYADQLGSVTATADATGQQLDPDSGLYYYKARWYSPYMGRFLSADPALLADGLQTYTYVGNDPINYRDPDGRLRQIAKGWWKRAKPWLEWAPVIGDGIAFKDAWDDPSLTNLAAAGIGLVPGVGDAAGKLLKHSDEAADFLKAQKQTNSIMDQMVLDAARKGEGGKIVDNLSDPKFKGMDKYSYGETSAQGYRSEVHYVVDPKTGQIMDYKVKHSYDGSK